MITIIKWLQGIEHRANQLYSDAAKIYNDDVKLRKFLENAAEDEAWHFHVMDSAADFILKNSVSKPAISLDEETRSKIFQILHDLQYELDNRNISKEELVKKIVELELSEWNDIFLYVVDTLKNFAYEFNYPVAKIQSHLSSIENFLENLEYKPEILAKISDLQPVWVENILIVDDERQIAELLKSLLNRKGNIDLAYNGKEALELIRKKFYKLIITDIDMPQMDGISLFEEAVSKYNTLRNRFLIMSGRITDDRRNYFEKRKIKYIEKPFEISLLRNIASDIILLNN